MGKEKHQEQKMLQAWNKESSAAPLHHSYHVYGFLSVAE
jgi:hypothetical protein